MERTRRLFEMESHEPPVTVVEKGSTALGLMFVGVSVAIAGLNVLLMPHTVGGRTAPRR